ncbi:histone-lysine N-methyltransferase SETMAR-like [Cryptotermes secundus]|uniref:histone-lysine N-methyltransferase SETMAR-like n=1 Tax=Cryptotermes secundus TaxID=105785 RepID=UPI000CD7DC94|nr:histone-lysine N-methyltransferase SETMAR-like [Cryptotermes secundus]
MATVFWDQEGILLLDWLPPSTTFDSDRYCNSRRQLRRRIQQRRHGKWGRGVLFKQDNARPHGSRQTFATLGALGYTVLPHPPYSSDLAPSDYALFDETKDVMRGKTFSSSDELQAVVQQWCRDTPKEWFAV